MNGLIKKNTNKKDIKGFILLELVIVLVIILLLLAFLIPLVTKHIDTAKQNAEVSEARSVKVAMQTIIAKDYMDDNVDDFIELVSHDNVGLSKEGKKEVERLLKSNIGYVDQMIVDDNNVIRGFAYITVNGSKIIYMNGNYSIEYTY